VFTTSPNKVDDALRLGADEVVLSRDANAMQKHAGSFDFILDAVSADHDINSYIHLLARDGNMTLVGAPEKPLSLSPFGLIFGRRSVSGSPIGGLAETQEMLNFCGEHNITSDVEVIAIQQINEAYARLLKADVSIASPSTWLLSGLSNSMVKHFRVAGSLRTRLEESGVLVSDVLRRAGLPQNLFHQTRILVTTEELFALWRAISEVSNDPEIGLKLGIETKTERFHPIGIAALSTENFGAAIQHMARYKKLSAPEEILHQVEGQEWSIQFRWTLAVEVEPQALIEHCFAWALTIARHGSGTHISPVRVELVQPRVHMKALERHFGCPVVCGKSRNAMVFRAGDAALPFVTRNAELLDMLAPSSSRISSSTPTAKTVFSTG
jgi:hypothetical protein